VIDLPTMTVDDPGRLQWALGRYAAGADLADMIHIAASAELAWPTFDRRAAAGAGADAPISIETRA